MIGVPSRRRRVWQGVSARGRVPAGAPQASLRSPSAAMAFRTLGLFATRLM